MIARLCLKEMDMINREVWVPKDFQSIVTTSPEREVGVRQHDADLFSIKSQAQLSDEDG